MQARFAHVFLTLALALLAGCGPAVVGQVSPAARSAPTGEPSRKEATGDASPAKAAVATPPKTIVGKDGAEMVYVPAGKFIMGAPDQHYDQRPVHEMTTDAYYIDKFEVTNAQYEKFVDATGYHVPYLDTPYAQDYNWKNGTYPEGKADYPVVLVDWNDAKAYADWAGKRLPAEPEWEKAARGTEGQIFPWGDEPDVTRMNSWEAGPGHTTAVGSYPQGASPYGAMDMAGNVWEWTADWFDRYPGNEDVSDKYGTTYKVARGTSWGNVIKYARGSNRHWIEPWTIGTLIGFRTAQSGTGK